MTRSRQINTFTMENVVPEELKDHPAFAGVIWKDPLRILKTKYRQHIMTSSVNGLIFDIPLYGSREALYSIVKDDVPFDFKNGIFTPSPEVKNIPLARDQVEVCKFSRMYEFPAFVGPECEFDILITNFQNLDNMKIYIPCIRLNGVDAVVAERLHEDGEEVSVENINGFNREVIRNQGKLPMQGKLSI